jgi:hypothetical protein
LGSRRGRPPSGCDRRLEQSGSELISQLPTVQDYIPLSEQCKKTWADLHGCQNQLISTPFLQ